MDANINVIKHKYVLQKYIMGKFYAITVATQNGGYYDCLKHTCIKNNIRLITLGWNKKWKNFAWRWKLYDNYINMLNDADIILWIDAYDVLIIESKNAILQKFKKFDTGIVFGADESTISNIAFNICDKPILNGGCHIGYVKFIKTLTSHMQNPKLIAKWNNDDQNMLNEIQCTKNFFNLHTKSDLNSDIFYVARVYDLVKNNYVNNVFTNKQSSIIHGCGGLNMNEYALKLKCNSNKIITHNRNFKINQAVNIVLNILYLRQKLMCIIVMAILLFCVIRNF